MKKDIAGRADIERLVNLFYDKVINDKVLGPVFSERVDMKWEKHLPLMYDFWDNILFYSDNYDGNPMDLHTHLGQAISLEKKHFRRWNQLFSGVVDECFAGPKADLIKERSLRIAAILQQKILSGGGLEK